MDSEDTLMMDALSKDPDSGDLVQGYQLGQLLGRGANGSVFMATKPGQAETYALKLIDTQGHPKAFVDRVLRECSITTGLRHPGIIAVHEAGYWGAYIFIVMDVAIGRAADHYGDGMLGWELAAEVTRRVAVALDHAYTSARVIHRDIKPANIVIDLVGGNLRAVKVVDFGLSRSTEEQGEGQGLTLTGVVLGTPFYMSPEQARGDRNLTFQTDLYALGATLFYLIAGRPPFYQGTAVEILVKHCNEAPPRLIDVAPKCPREVSDIVARCLAKEPAGRWPSYRDLVQALDGVLGENPFEFRSSTGGAIQPSSRYTHRSMGAAAATPSVQADQADERQSSSSNGSDALGELFRSKIQETTRSFRKKPPTVVAAPPAKPVARTRPVPKYVPPVNRPPSLANGQLIDSAYTVLTPLGAGAMGEVYAVRDRFAERDLALKILSEEDMRRPGAVRRFQGESTALATVDHATFPFFAGKGSHLGRDYLLMERIAGIDLKEFLKKNGPMAEREALWVMGQLADAMDRAYAKCGMVHRDIKPANLMFSKHDVQQLKIVDFGVSTYIDYGDYEDFSDREYKYIDDDSQGKAVGTPAYMSPEQCVGQPPSPMMDIYAIGCTFFQLLTGRTPYQAPNAGAMMMKHIQEAPPSLDGIIDVSSGTSYLLKRCLAKNPRDRFKNFKQLRDAVNSAKFSLTTRTKRQNTQGFTRPG